MTCPRDIVFFDVETPNRRNDSICAIGAYRVSSDGSLVSQVYEVVDPEAPFTYDNISIHGIEPQDIDGCPNFAELWDAELCELFSGADLVAHGAAFDLNVLAKTLSRYRKKMGPVMYSDTRQLARVALPELKHHNLDDVAAEYGFDFAHHHARHDAECCMRIFFKMEEDGAFSRDDASIWNEFDFAEAAAKAGQIRHRDDVRTSVVDDLPDIVERSAYNADLTGAVVCLTGDFEMSPYSIEPVITYIEGLGATHSKNMTLSVDYLVVGNLGSPRWKHGNYGNKIANAMRWREEGKSAVRIIDEDSITSGDFVF